jgi:general stress protein YciG
MITPEDRKRYASMGGKALRPEQRSFSQNRQLASEAGRKGGSSPKKKLATLAVESTLLEDIAFAGSTK